MDIKGNIKSGLEIACFCLIIFAAFFSFKKYSGSATFNEDRFN